MNPEARKAGDGKRSTTWARSRPMRPASPRSGRQALQSNNRSPPALSSSGARRITLVQVSTLIDPHAKVQDRGGRRPAV